jgi:hypothetical protein
MAPGELVEVACCVARMHCTDGLLCAAVADRVRADLLGFSRPELRALLGALRLMRHEDSELEELVALHTMPVQQQAAVGEGAAGEGSGAVAGAGGAAPCPLRMIGMVR